MGIFLLIGASVGLIQYNSNFRGTDNNDDKWRTDKKPIMDRFPNIGNFDNCYWKANTSAENTRLSTPGPTSYWMKGFIILNEKDFDNFKIQYKWNDTSVNWQPLLDTSILQMKSFKWKYSEEFNSKIKSSSYVGQFYLDFENGIIYFDIQK